MVIASEGARCLQRLNGGGPSSLQLEASRREFSLLLVLCASEFDWL